MYLNKTLLYFLLIINTFTLFAQIENTQYQPIKNLSEIEYTIINLPAEKAQTKNKVETLYKSLEFAKPINVSLSSEADGKWQISNDTKIWRLGIVAPGAKSINISFSKFNLAADEKVWVYNPSYTEVYGAFTEINNIPSQTLMIRPMNGDTAIIEFHVPAYQQTSSELAISEIGYGIIDLKSNTNTSASGSCNIDINCPLGADWKNEKRAVVKLLIGGTFCTGTLMNTTDNSGKSYVLTARHCLSTNEAANATVAIFNYEAESCGSSKTLNTKSVSGARLVATTTGTNNLDFALIEFYNKIPYHYKPYYAGWNASNTASAKSTTIHHPSGDVKKISIDLNPVLTSSFVGYVVSSHWNIVEWDSGVTEKGSSGSALFDSNHLVVGDLSGGTSSCSNYANDLYAKFSYSFNFKTDTNQQLQYWLDPLKSGVFSTTGYDPYNNHCGDISNITPSDTLFNYNLNSPESGYITGTNSLGINEYAEKIRANGETYIYGIKLNVAVASDILWQNQLKCRFYDSDSLQNSLSIEKSIGTILATTADSIYEVLFDNPVIMHDSFFVSYLFDNQINDTFALKHTFDETNLESNSAFFFYNGNWYSFLEAYGASVKLGLSLITCDEYITKIKNVPANEQTQSTSIALFPNPSKDYITVQANNNLENCWVKIINTNGNTCESKQYKSFSTDVFNINELPDGVYIVIVENAQQRSTSKFIVRH